VSKAAARKAAADQAKARKAAADQAKAAGDRARAKRQRSGQWVQEAQALWCYSRPVYATIVVGALAPTVAAVSAEDALGPDRSAIRAAIALAYSCHEVHELTAEPS
jgi:hypothetical protein